MTPTTLFSFSAIAPLKPASRELSNKRLITFDQGVVAQSHFLANITTANKKDTKKQLIERRSGFNRILDDSSFGVQNPAKSVGKLLK